MKHARPTLQASSRELIGTRYAQRLRKSGRLPAVIYGHKIDPVAVSVDEKEVLGHLLDGVHLFEVAVEGHKNETCLVKDLQFGFLGDDVIHIDFARVDLSETVQVTVPLLFVGEPDAAKTAGAVLRHALPSLEVSCRADSIPDEIRVDLSELTETFTVGDIQMPAGVTTDLADSRVVAQITYVQEEEVGEEAAVADTGDEPQVITEAEPKAEGSEKEGD